MKPRISLFEFVLTRTSVTFLREFFRVWPLSDILVLSATSFRMHYAVQTYKSVAWDIDSFLGRWFPRPVAFRHLLRQCSAVVSGSQALQFFDRTEYMDSDMDIFLRGAGVGRMSEWLKEVGYSLPSRNYYLGSRKHIVHRYRNRRRYCSSAIQAVITFTRFDTTPGGVVYPRRVQLVVVDMDPVKFILFDFHSSTSFFF